MQHTLKRTLAVLALLLIPAMSLCPCAMIGSTREIAGGSLQALGKGHCHDHAGGTPRGGPESPCGSETCHHCPTDLLGVTYSPAAHSPTLTVLSIYGSFSSPSHPAPSAGRPDSIACDLPPPNLSRPILELNCCFLI